MDVVTAGVALGALGRVLKLGLALHKVGEKWGLSGDELAALESLVNAGRDVAGLFAVNGVAPSARLIALHTAVITRAFGTTCRQHWARNEAMSGGFEKRSWVQRIGSSSKDTARQRDIETRLRGALDRIARLGEGGAAQGFEAASAMLHEPVASPCYAALWESFTNPLLDEEDLPKPLGLDDPGAKLEFERLFRLAYAEALSSSPDLARGIFDLTAGRPGLLSELVVRNVATWRGRHVFGSLDAPGVPRITLGDIYVEPDGIARGQAEGTSAGRPQPITALLRDLLNGHKIIVVRGDFGQGKSLTARTLACAWAEQYVTDKETRSAALWYPLFIKCGEDFPPREPTLERVVARAMQRQAREIGIDIAERDGALGGPGAGSRIVYLIDGLDEVALHQREIEEFFGDISASLGGAGRAIIFSRKGVIPPQEKLRGIPVVDIGHLRTEGERPGGQVGEWLDRWNGLSGMPPISVERLQQKGLLEIARTPILLFMTAMTWDEGRDGVETVAEVYERFFVQIAVGKCRQDGDRHGPVAEASQELLERLVSLRELEKPEPDVAAWEAQASAMLWMLGRMAWEGRRCAARDEDLSMHEMTSILKEEVGQRGESHLLDMIRVGVLLVLQADHTAGNDKILFGHKSFREFLVARYWAHRLRQIVASRHDHRSRVEDHLLGARLLEDEDRSFDFLMQIVNGPSWDDASRVELVKWAEECFNNDGPDFASNHRLSWLADRRPVLREAALAIGSATAGARGLSADGPLTLRSLLAWFWATHRSTAKLVARRLSSPSAVLEQANLLHADLEWACLDGSNLSFATLAGTRLCNCSLENGILVNVRVTDSNFDGAMLDGADFEQSVFRETSFRNAKLRQASFRLANMVEVHFDGARLEGSFFEEAQLEGASFSEANLQGAQLEDANLGKCNFEMANLVNANLRRANLVGASFKDANLAGANFEDTDLHGAFDARVIFRAARFDASTRWPKGFDPVAAGALEMAPMSSPSPPSSWPPMRSLALGTSPSSRDRQK